MLFIEKALNYLTMVANNNLSVNLMLHAAFILVGVVFFTVKNPLRSHIVNAFLAVVSGSVFLHAVVFKNPFIGLLFLIVTSILVFELFRRKNIFEFTGSRVIDITAVLLLVFGFAYPHFMNISLAEYLLYAPVGIVPCPTLITILGFYLLNTRPGKGSYWTITIISTIFSLIGIIMFKVYIDIVLVLAVGLSYYKLLARKVN